MRRFAVTTFGACLACLALVPADACAQGNPAAEAPPFQVKVILTPAASKDLAARGEKLRVFGYYSGEPKPGVRTHDGEVDLRGSFDITNQPLDGTIAIPKQHLNPAGLRKSQGEPRLLVNVVSARCSSPDNLLSCDVYEGSQPAISSQRITLHCGLIAERPETKMISSF